MKAQKKPIVIDYYIFDGNVPKLQAWVESFGQPFQDNFNITWDVEKRNQLFVKTLEGTSYEVTTDDVIIRGINGEYYPCKKSIFEKTYDLL